MKMRSTIISGVKDTVPNTLSLRIEDLSETETSLLGWEGGRVVKGRKRARAALDWSDWSQVQEVGQTGQVVNR